jgi:hypothetical protein
MRRIYFSVLFVLAAITANAQQLLWSVKSTDNAGFDNPHIEIFEGHAVVTASFNQTIALGPFAFTDTATGGVLVRFTPQGAVEWAVKLPGAAQSHTIDNSGNTYVCGTRPATGTGPDIYIAKFNTSGQLVWQHDIPCAGDDKAAGIVKDAQNRIWFSGNVEAPCSFDSYTIGQGFFIARLSENGNPDIVRTGRGSYVYGMKADTQGNVFTLGLHGYDTTRFEALPPVEPSVYAECYYAIKISPNGDPLSIRVLQGTYKTNIFLPRPLPDGSILAVYEHHYDGSELQMFNDTYSYIAWSKPAGQGNLLLRTKDFGFYDASLILFTGHVTTNNAAFGGYPFTPGVFCGDSVHHSGAFIMATDIDGTCTSPLITIPHAVGFSIAADASGIYLCGSIPEGIAVGDTASTVTSAESALFVARFSNGNIPLGMQESHKENNIEIYPNPNTGRFAVQGKEGRITIYNSMGACIYKAELEKGSRELNMENSVPGIYFIEWRKDEKREIRKLVIN